jgi:DNA polymerase III subunit gamma/tau
MVKYPPAVGRYKVYIIDEVHMLSTAAENAFLKTLEEPPEHAIFILATTDPQKVRSTIRSRCMQLNFRRVTEEELIEGMRRICAKRGINATNDALATIASRADGSVRDALSILEQCTAAGDKELSRAAVLEYTGAAGQDFFLALTGAVIGSDAGKALVYIDEIIRRGKDPRQILKDWLKHMRDLMIVKYVGKAERIVGASGENIARLKAQAELTDTAFIERSIRLISEYINLGRYSERPRILLETAAVRLASPDDTAEAPARRPLRPAPAREAAASRQAEIAARRAAAEAPARSMPAQRTAQAPAEEESGSGSDALADMIASVQQETPGNPAEMWDRIVRAVSATDRTFMSLVGRYSAGSEYDAGRLLVIVSPGKLRLAEDKAADIAHAAKSIYGSDVYVSMKAGVLSKAGAAETSTSISEEETTKIINEDINKNEVIGDIQDLFGITPVIEN